MRGMRVTILRVLSLRLTAHQLTTQPLPLPHGTPKRSPSSLCPSSRAWHGGQCLPLHLICTCFVRGTAGSVVGFANSQYQVRSPWTSCSGSVCLLRCLLSFPHCHSDLSLDDTCPRLPHAPRPTRPVSSQSSPCCRAFPVQYHRLCQNGEKGGFVLLTAYRQGRNVVDVQSVY